MGGPAPWQAWVAAGALVGYWVLTSATNRWVPEAYMDEPFHVTQTQAYCAGRWHEWDPKITTFPGLYLVGTFWARLLAAVAAARGSDASMVDVCTGHNLRYVNATLSAVCLCLFWAIGADMAAGFKGSKQGTGSTGAGQASDTQDAGNQRAGGVTRWLLQPASPLELALMLAAYPLHAFYAPLYYTDVGALAALLTCHLLLLRGRPYAATAAALAAVAFRQTNAVWVAFLLGDALLREASAAAISMPQQRPPPPAQPAAAEGAAAEQPSLLEELASVLAALWEARWRLLAHYAPLAAVPAAFVAFVVLNGGVAVGDKEAHAPVRHIMQCHYCALWLAAAAAPPLLEHARQVAAGAGAVRRRLGMAGSAALAAAGLAMVAGSVASPTPGPHPYLLADNRHYTFYLWRRLLGGPLQLRIMLVPAFLASWALLAGVLLQRKSRLWCMGLLACTAAVLLPAWLLELRYFTVPYMLLALHMPQPARWAVLLTAASYLALDLATWHIFMRRPFAWGDGSIARFMW